jgi:hypothetical protein
MGIGGSIVNTKLTVHLDELLDGITEANRHNEIDTGPAQRSDMCRNIKTLYNFDPPATDDEIRAAALQFVRKISGFATPSAANEEAFIQAVDQVARASSALLDSLVTGASPKNREVEAARAHARAVHRFGR